MEELALHLSAVLSHQREREREIPFPSLLPSHCGQVGESASWGHKNRRADPDPHLLQHTGDWALASSGQQ